MQAHALFSVGPNFYPVARTALANKIAIPGKYYVPGRVREAYRPRLEAALLWNVGDVDADGKTQEGDKSEDVKHADAVRRTFGRERVCSCALLLRFLTKA